MFGTLVATALTVIAFAAAAIILTSEWSELAKNLP